MKTKITQELANKYIEWVQTNKYEKHLLTHAQVLDMVDEVIAPIVDTYVKQLEQSTYRLEQVLLSNRARRAIEESISNDILDGTYEPWPSDFDYETDFHSKLQEFVKENKKP